MRTVLIVDDEFGIVDVLAAGLQDKGYRVLTAANGRRGLDSLAENKIDIVVLDFMMPLVDGPAMARTMRAETAYRDIPIVMVSALPEPAVREGFAEYQAFLRKPFPVSDLLRVIGTVASQSWGDGESRKLGRDR